MKIIPQIPNRIKDQIVHIIMMLKYMVTINITGPEKADHIISLEADDLFLENILL